MTQIHEIYPYPLSHDIWMFRDEKLKTIYQYWDDVRINWQMGRILGSLLSSLGIKRVNDEDEYWINPPKFKLSFSSEIFSDYQIKLQSYYQTKNKNIFYRVIEGPGIEKKYNQEAAISEVIALAYFSTIPEFIYARVDLIEE